ncbi:hypothetical protein HBI79_176950 [Parastagonospora nodorum]|nr:hypothetical protein HBI79_176950 [Parastagonospora nodorum]KAH5319883.1 hypothetical protein HBI12_106600 [Parastagonospora nodorum]
MKTIGKRDMETHDVHQVTAVAMVQAKKLLFLAETVSTSRRIWKDDSVDRSCYAEADVKTQRTYVRHMHDISMMKRRDVQDIGPYI